MLILVAYMSPDWVGPFGDLGVISAALVSVLVALGLTTAFLRKWMIAPLMAEVKTIKADQSVARYNVRELVNGVNTLLPSGRQIKLADRIEDLPPEHRP